MKIDDPSSVDHSSLELLLESESGEMHRLDVSNEGKQKFSFWFDLK